MAFTVDKASTLSGLAPGRIRYWAMKGIQRPSLVYEPGTPYGFLYSFRDLVSLRILKKLRDEHEFSLQQLREINGWLRAHYDEPWATLRFVVVGDQLAFTDEEKGSLISASRYGQTMVKEIDVNLVAVRNEMDTAAKRLRERKKEDIGKVSRSRLVFQNEPLIAGTRVPTSTIWNYYDEGYGIQDILQRYPFLDPEDIQAAMEYESRQRSTAAS